MLCRADSGRLVDVVGEDKPGCRPDTPGGHVVLHEKLFERLANVVWVEVERDHAGPVRPVVDRRRDPVFIRVGERQLADELSAFLPKLGQVGHLLTPLERRHA